MFLFFFLSSPRVQISMAVVHSFFIIIIRVKLEGNIYFYIFKNIYFLFLFLIFLNYFNVLIIKIIFKN